MELVRNLCHKRSLTVVAVLHDVNIAARFCDELIALHSGQQVARGTPEEVVQPDSLLRIFGVEMGVVQHPRRGIPVSYVG
jgi:iron complex transport system ATP-binding protein